jgi:hypothetical protein
VDDAVSLPDGSRVSCDFRSFDAPAAPSVAVEPDAPSLDDPDVDDATGVDLLTRVSLVDGGTEHRGPDGGLVYRDTRTVEPVRIADTQIRTSVGMTERHFDVPVELDHPDWSLTWRYTFRAAHPRIAIDLVIVAGGQHNCPGRCGRLPSVNRAAWNVYKLSARQGYARDGDWRCTCA